MSDIVKNMEALARKWHEGKFRRGPGNVPYIEHPAAVVKKLRDWGYDDEHDAVTLAVGWGHDLIEDTKVTEAEILAAGGPEVLAGIKTLSFVLPKVPYLSHAERDAKKEEYIQNVAKTAAPEILVVKMADRFCNVMDFLRANDKWAIQYYDLGRCLFERLDETKNPCRVDGDLNTLVGMIDEFESGVTDVVKKFEAERESASEFMGF